MITKRSLGFAISEYRGKAGLTQLELSEASGVSLSALRSWEQGIRQPGALYLLRLALALDLRTEDLFARADQLQEPHA